MRNLIKITGLTATACLLGLTSNLVLAQNASSLSGLLDLVENDRIAESAEYVQRQQEFEQNASNQQQILDTTNERIVEQEQTQSDLSDQFEANEIIIRDNRDILLDLLMHADWARERGRGSFFYKFCSPVWIP